MIVGAFIFGDTAMALFCMGVCYLLLTDDTAIFAFLFFIGLLILMIIVVILFKPHLKRTECDLG